MIKYYILKEFTVNVKSDGKGNSYSLDCEDCVPLYDTEVEAYNRIVREILSMFKGMEEEINLEYSEIVSLMMKKRFDFVVEQNNEYGINKQRVIKKNDGVIVETDCESLYMSKRYHIVEIEKDNVLYAITGNNSEDCIIQDDYHCGIFDRLESASFAFSNYNFFHKDDSTYVQLFILDKEKIYDDDFLCRKIVELGFLKGFVKEAVNSLDYFNPELVMKNVLEIRSEVVKQNNENKKKIESLETTVEKNKERIKSVEKQNSTLKKEKEELENKIMEARKVLALR